MPSTALEICQASALELGLPTLTTVYNATATQTGKQMGALLNRVCKELAAQYDWTKLQIEFTLEVEEPIAYTGTLTEGSRIVTALSPSTAGLSAAYSVTGGDLTQSARVVSVDSATQVTLNQDYIGDTEAAVAISFVRDTFELPADQARYIPDTWWDRTNNWRLIGPVSPQLDSWLLSGIIQSGPRRRWRQIGSGAASWRVWPPPNGQDSPAILTWEYISDAWAFDALGEPVSVMTADDDEPMFPEHVLALGLKAYFWMQKGFDWEPQYRLFAAAADRAYAQDGSRPTITISEMRPRGDLLDLANLPDGNWPGEGNP